MLKGKTEIQQLKKPDSIERNYSHAYSASTSRSEEACVGNVPIEVFPSPIHIVPTSSTLEKNSLNKVQTEIYRDYNHPVSTNNVMTQAYPVEIPIEENRYNPPFPTGSVMTQEFLVQPPNRINSVHTCLSTENTQMQEASQIKHEYYRFAYDLVEKVLEIRGELNPHVPSNLPEPPIYLFTSEYENIIKSFLEVLHLDTTHLEMELYQHTQGIYNLENYMKYRDSYIRIWKAGAYSEEAFIKACTGIVNVAAHFLQKKFYCGALDNAVAYIAWWIEDILKRGSIQNSSW